MRKINMQHYGVLVRTADGGIMPRLIFAAGPKTAAGRAKSECGHDSRVVEVTAESQMDDYAKEWWGLKEAPSVSYPSTPHAHLDY